MKGLMRCAPVVRPCEEDGVGYNCQESLCRRGLGSRSAGRPRKRWLDTMKEGLKKRGLDIRQARRMMQDRSEWGGFVRGNAWGVAWRMNP